MKITKDTTETQITHRRRVSIEDGPVIEPRYFFTAGTQLKVRFVAITWDEGQEIKQVNVSGHRVLKGGKLGANDHTVTVYRTEFPDWLQELVSESVAIKA